MHDMVLRERQKDILLKIVREYIKLAHPISSDFLKEKYNFPFSPATIRSEMHELTKKGLLFQPHSSAGRIPTEKGYRIFVNHIMKEGIREFEIEKYLKENFKNEIVFIQFLAKTLVELSRALISIYLKKEKFYFETGWQEILKEPEFKDEEFLLRFVNFSKEIKLAVEKLKENAEIRVYIGKEIPIKGGRDFSIILLSSTIPTSGKIIITLCGPQRMDYNKNIRVFAGVKRFLKSL